MPPELRQEPEEQQQLPQHPPPVLPQAIQVSEQAVQEVIQRAEAQLQNVTSAPFSEHGFTTLKQRISEYVRDLVVESVRVSKRHKSDVVSANDVNTASETLVAKRVARASRFMGSLGGILLGAGVGNLAALLSADKISTSGIVITFVFAIVGAIMTAYHLFKD